MRKSSQMPFLPRSAGLGTGTCPNKGSLEHCQSDKLVIDLEGDRSILFPWEILICHLFNLTICHYHTIPHLFNSHFSLYLPPLTLPSPLKMTPSSC